MNWTLFLTSLNNKTLCFMGFSVYQVVMLCCLFTYKLYVSMCHLKESIFGFIPCKLYLTKVISIFGNCQTAKKQTCFDNNPYTLEHITKLV